MRPPFSGLVLAAGRSSRMGRDKATLEIDGVPMWQRQRDLLASAGASELFLSARPEQEWVRGALGFSALLRDNLPNAGPIAGITAGLERTSCSHVFVLAIDLPRMDPAWPATLLALSGPDVGAVGRRAGFFEPLAAIYPRALLDLFWEAVAAGRYALQPVLAKAAHAGLLRVHDITPAEAPWFENWNEPQLPPSA